MTTIQQQTGELGLKALNFQKCRQVSAATVEFAPCYDEISLTFFLNGRCCRTELHLACTPGTLAVLPIR